MKVVCDYTKCTGLGLCESLAPDFFEVQDDGSLIILREEGDEDERGMLEDAVASCPTEALRLEG